MATFNGYLLGSTTFDGSTATTVTGTTGGETINTVNAVPMKMFKNAVLALQCVDGISGAFGVEVIASVGGATFVIAGKTDIDTVGNYVLGTTAKGLWLATDNTIPRPTKAVFETAGDIAGWTAYIYLMGEYN